MSDAGGQIVLRIIGGCFTPDGHRVAAYITSKFKERFSPAGTTWKRVDPDMKQFYYDEFLKRYTWETEHEAEFYATWNAACAKLYKDMLYKARQKGIKPSYVPENIWDAWRAIWVVDRWQENAMKARANRKSELAGPSTGATKHTAGSRSIVEHALDLEHDLQRPPTCWEIFTKTHKSKDGNFIDRRSSALDEEIAARVAQASQPSLEGGEEQTLSTDQINEIYYDVVGGRKKTSTLYGLGAQARVVYDQAMAPRARGRPSTSSSASESSARVDVLEQENADLKTRLSTLEAEFRVERQSRLDLEKIGWDMQAFLDQMSATPHRFASQETQVLGPKSS
ncbi:uncharacterized protein LOC121991257 [Zingiber officinale]|uniref:uncharacterized protein LOC121991257 n=1 Tax=Zingiber officinale TaxID=94328 RepID=UPI001C4B4814|nr:uncharacterized protein LOC121991257 [Zingiber officinale]